MNRGVRNGFTPTPNMNGGNMNNANMNNTNMNGTGGRSGSSLGREALFEEIRALGFVKTELELYLDTHPTCSTAIDYYAQTLAALARYTEEHESRFGPLTAAGVKNGERWTWVDTPWPWHTGDGNGWNGRTEEG